MNIISTTITPADTIQTVSPDSITLLSENIGIIMEANIQKYASMKTQDLPTIRLGRVNGKTFGIDHYEAILGCKQSKKNVRCIIEEYENVSDIMIKHFRDVMSNDIINTPLIYNSVDSLQEKLKTDKITVLKILGIDKNQYAHLLTTTNNISEAAISKLEKLVTELSKRNGLTAIQASIPVYMLEKISRITDEKQQLTLIHFIELDSLKKNDSRFFWMTPEQIDSMVQLIRQDATHTEHKREESTVAELVPIEEIGEAPKEKKKKKSNSSGNKTDSQNQTQENTKKNKQKNPTTKRTKQILDTIPNMMIIPDEKGNPEYLVDKKTSAVSKIDSASHKDIIKTQQMSTKRLYSIPLDVAKFLGMGEEDGHKQKIRHKNITGMHGLQSFVKSQKDHTQRYTIFWNSQ